VQGGFSEIKATYEKTGQGAEYLKMIWLATDDLKKRPPRIKILKVQ